MNAHAKKLWVEGLRSTIYRQGKESLLKNRAFCALGALCDVWGKESGYSWGGRGSGERTMLGEAKILPEAVAAWAGLEVVPFIENRSLPELNDVLEYSFAEIADRIEKYL